MKFSDDTRRETRVPPLLLPFRPGFRDPPQVPPVQGTHHLGQCRRCVHTHFAWQRKPYCISGIAGVKPDCLPTQRCQERMSTPPAPPPPHCLPRCPSTLNPLILCRPAPSTGLSSPVCPCLNGRTPPSIPCYRYPTSCTSATHCQPTWPRKQVIRYLVTSYSISWLTSMHTPYKRHIGCSLSTRWSYPASCTYANATHSPVHNFMNSPQRWNTLCLWFRVCRHSWPRKLCTPTAPGTWPWLPAGPVSHPCPRLPAQCVLPFEHLSACSFRPRPLPVGTPPLL